MLPATYEVVGALSLGALWVEAALVAAAALRDLRDPRALGLRFGGMDGIEETGDAEHRVALLEVQVEHGEGPGGAVATHEVAQTGRALDGDLPQIGFRDRGYA